MRPVTDFDIVNAMQRMGGSFMQAIGQAATRADEKNLAKLKMAFAEEWAEYALLAEYRLAKLEKAGAE